jgi:hypothetical protein
MRTCWEARHEVLRLLPDQLPLDCLKEKRTMHLRYSRLADLVCFDDVSHSVFTSRSFDARPDQPPMSITARAIGFDAAFVERHLLQHEAARHYGRIGCLLEMMPAVRHIYVVDHQLRSLRAAFPFRIMAGRYGASISLHRPPHTNLNVRCPHDFLDLVDAGQHLCRVLRNHGWARSPIRNQEVSVYVLSPARVPVQQL